MERELISISFILALFFLFGCETDSDENFQFVTLEVTSANFPVAFNQNQEHMIEVTFRRPDGCTFFSDFEISTQGFTERSVVAFGSQLSQEDCSVSIEEGVAILNFTAVEPISYTFRFYRGTNANGEPDYLEYLIPVKPEGIE